MGSPIFNARARELLLGAQEDLREAAREIDDLEAFETVLGIVESIDDVLDWEDMS